MRLKDYLICYFIHKIYKCKHMHKDIIANHIEDNLKILNKFMVLYTVSAQYKKIHKGLSFAQNYSIFYSYDTKL